MRNVSVEKTECDTCSKITCAKKHLGLLRDKATREIRNIGQHLLGLRGAETSFPDSGKSTTQNTGLSDVRRDFPRIKSH